MKCDIENCNRIATRSTKRCEHYCEKHYWENADGSSVEEEASTIQHKVKGNYD